MNVMRSTDEDKQRVLIVDDEMGPRESLRFLFDKLYAVVCVPGVDEAVQAIKDAPFDAVVMDIKMPGKTGIDGLREIRAIDPHVSILMLTGFGSLDTARNAIRLGANDYIQKPFDVNEMRSVVADAVVRSGLERARAETEAHLNALNVQLQQQLQQQAALATLGQASEAFVHDLRNPLTVISGYVDLLMRSLNDMTPFVPERAREMQEYLRMIEQGAERCQEMSSLWRDLGKLDPTRVRFFDVRPWVEDVMASARDRAERAGVRLALNQGPDISLQGVQTQLFRALLNLVNNAVDACLNHGGLVTVGWRVTSDFMECTVDDNGEGVPDEMLSTIFDPQVSTKRISGGMGLGLFIVRQVVEAHGGSVVVENRPSGGARARMRLPWRPSPSAEAT